MQEIPGVDSRIIAFVRAKMGDHADSVTNFMKGKEFSLLGQTSVALLCGLAREHGVPIKEVIPKLQREYDTYWQHQVPEIRGDPDATGSDGVQNRTSFEKIYSELGIPYPQKR